MDASNPLYAALNGGETCARLILSNSREMIVNQGDKDTQRELLDKQLILLNVAMAISLAYRETLSMPPAVSHE
jgi:hypothetical protein